MTEQEALMLAQAGIDGSGTLLIDADTRSIYVPESEKFFGVESDQNVERKKFKCPKIVGDNIDLSTLHLYINYQNGNGNKDSYMIQDMAVSGDYITFSWVLSRNVAAYKGTVRFIFCAKKADSSGNLVNEWNTTVAEGEVIEGLEATTTVADNNPDIIEQMLTLLKNVSDEPVFTEARTRENVTNGDKVPVLWGKVKKWFADLGTAAFCKVVNNLTTAAEGGVLDARQGKELNDALTKLNKLMGNTDISGIGNGTVTGALLTLNSKQIRTKKITELLYFSVTVTTGSPYGDFAFYFDGFEYDNDPAISINPIDGVSLVINSFLINNTTGKINGVRLQAKKNGTWLFNTELSVTGTVIGQ